MSETTDETGPPRPYSTNELDLIAKEVGAKELPTPPPWTPFDFAVLAAILLPLIFLAPVFRGSSPQETNTASATEDGNHASDQAASSAKPLLVATDPETVDMIYCRGTTGAAQARTCTNVIASSTDKAVVASAYMHRCAGELRDGEIKQAPPDCDKAIELKPDLALAWYHRGLLRLQLHDDRGAEEDFRRSAIEEIEGVQSKARGNSDSAKICFNLDGKASLHSVIAACSEEIEHSTDSAVLARAFTFRCSAEFVVGKEEAAEADCNAALRQAPSFPFAFLIRASIRDARGYSRGSYEDYDAAHVLGLGVPLGTNPFWINTKALPEPELNQERGVVFTPQENCGGKSTVSLAQKIAACQLIIGDARARSEEVGSAHAHACELRLLQLGGVSAAELSEASIAADCDAAVRQAPQSAYAHFVRGNFFITKTDYAHAVVEFDQAIGLEPNEGLTTEAISTNRDIAYTLFYDSAHSDYSLHVARRTPQLSKQVTDCERTAATKKLRSAACYRTLVREHPDEMALKTDLAALLASVCSDAFYSGRALSSRLRDCDESLSLRPNELWTFEARGGVNLKLGHWREAIGDFSEVLKRLPVADAYYGRYVALRRTGHEQEAQEDLTRAKELEPLIERTFGVSLDAIPEDVE